MAFSITFNITEEPAPTMARIMGEATKAGVKIHGDEQQGTFSGFNARGSYSREGNQIHVTISEKPFFITESLVRATAAAKAPQWGLSLA